MAMGQGWGAGSGVDVAQPLVSGFPPPPLDPPDFLLMLPLFLKRSESRHCYSTETTGPLPEALKVVDGAP